MQRSLTHLEQFEMQHKRALCEYRTFNQRMMDYYKAAHWNATTFVERTGLNAMTFSKLQKEGAFFETGTIVNMCVPPGLEYEIIMELLRLQGKALSPLIRHENAYRYVIERCKGLDYRECNAVFTEIGIEEQYHFGSKQYPKKRPK